MTEGLGHMTDEQITAALAEVGAAWLMDEQDEYGQPRAMRHLVNAAEDAARAEVLDAVDDDMPLDRALHLAELWAVGKLIGGDAHGVAVALLREVKRLCGA